MGFALANSAKQMGADVVLITTKEIEAPYKIINVKSALDMQKALDEEFDSSDIVIMAAAVADYRVKEVSPQKMKKGVNEELTLELIKNPDILKGLCEKKTHQCIIGFCAESENLIENAKEKITKKGCDFLIANDISRNDIGFGSEDNEVVILDKNGGMKRLEKASKSVIARQVLEYINE